MAFKMKPRGGKKTNPYSGLLKRGLINNSALRQEALDYKEISRVRNKDDNSTTVNLEADRPTYAETGVDPAEAQAYWDANPDKYEEYKNKYKKKIIIPDTSKTKKTTTTTTTKPVEFKAKPIHTIHSQRNVDYDVYKGDRDESGDKIMIEGSTSQHSGTEEFETGQSQVDLENPNPIKQEKIYQGNAAKTVEKIYEGNAARAVKKFGALPSSSSKSLGIKSFATSGSTLPTFVIETKGTTKKKI